MNNPQVDHIEETTEDTKNPDRYETADCRPSEPTVFVD